MSKIDIFKIFEDILIEERKEAEKKLKQQASKQEPASDPAPPDPAPDPAPPDPAPDPVPPDPDPAPAPSSTE